MSHCSCTPLSAFGVVQYGTGGKSKRTVLVEQPQADPGTTWHAALRIGRRSMLFILSATPCCSCELPAGCRSAGERRREGTGAVQSADQPAAGGGYEGQTRVPVLHPGNPPIFIVCPPILPLCQHAYTTITTTLRLCHLRSHCHCCCCRRRCRRRHRHFTAVNQSTDQLGQMRA